MSTITTYTKRSFNPVEPQQELIDIVDIAHALSLLCRANGHFPTFYSVAQHSVNCAREAAARGLSREIRLTCLLHDASEAYMSDLTRPVKRHFPEYLRMEERLQTAIYRKFGLSPSDDDREAVSQIDDAMLYWEFWTISRIPFGKTAPTLSSQSSFEQRDFKDVENEFLKLFEELKTAQ